MYNDNKNNFKKYTKVARLSLVPLICILYLDIGCLSQLFKALYRYICTSPG